MKKMNLLPNSKGRLYRVERTVADLYAQIEQNPSADEFQRSIYNRHVVVVADFAEYLAKKYHGSIKKCRSAALLHDIADTKLVRTDKKHENTSLTMAAHILKEAGFSRLEIEEIVDDAIRLHSCHGQERPLTLTGKILATADALAHFSPGFYEYMMQFMTYRLNEVEIKDWLNAKIDRDYHNKIAFEAEREAVRMRYEELKRIATT
jgi:HD superfamily phosphodiesterase